MSDKKVITIGNGSTLTAGNVHDAVDAIYSINTASYGFPQDYKTEWNKDQWLDYLRDYQDCEGFNEAIKTMNSKLYKELK